MQRLVSRLHIRIEINLKTDFCCLVDIYRLINKQKKKIKIMKNYYLKSFASLLVLTFSFLSLHAQDIDCDCEGEAFDPVCVVGPFGISFQVDNACIAECLELEIIDGDCDDWEDPWGDCDCEEPTDDEEGICVLIFDDIFQDSLVVWAPSECFISCWYGEDEYVITDCNFDDWPDDDGDCPPDDWEDCDCEFDGEGEGICFLYYDAEYQDTLEGWAPNECFITCWYDSIDYTITDCSWGNPWGDCDCEEPLDDEGVCFSYVDTIFQDSLIAWAPSECFIACWYEIDEYKIVDCDEWEDPWNDDCDCDYDEEGEGVCFIYYDAEYQDTLEAWAPNECFITCWYDSIDYTITDCDFGNPWDDCECEEPLDDEGVCFVYVDEFFGEEVQGWAPSECFIDCWYEIDEYELVDCEDWNPWGGECDCEEPTDDEGVCFLYFDEIYQDSVYGWAPSECFITCWYDSIAYTLTECDDYEEPGGEIDSCLLSLDLESYETLQLLLLDLAEVCDIELPECILNAPIFDTDEEFLEYIEENCDDLGGLNGDMMDELFDIVDQPLSPDEENALTASAIDLKVKSNPTQSEILYTISSEVEGPATISAVDLNGNVFEYNKVRLQSGANEFRMNINSLTSQIFVLHVQTATEYKTIKVFVE